MDIILTILSYVFWVGLALGVLVFVHELGHFLTAKLFGMRVDRFSLGFPPNVFSKQVGETEYAIGAIPLGGYVKIAGMIDESLDTDHVEEEPESWEFRAKPVWQRMIVISAGVIFNMILAAVVFSGLKYSYGETYIPAQNIEHAFVVEGSIAYEMGLRTGDKIVDVNGEPLHRFQDLFSPRTLSADQLTITVRRDSGRVTYTAPSNLLTRLSTGGIDGGGVSNQLGIYLPPLIGSVQEGSPAEEIGLAPGDRLLEINGQPVTDWSQLVALVQSVGGDSLALAWEDFDAAGGPAVRRDTLVPMKQGERYLIGVATPTTDVRQERYGVQVEQFGVGSSLVAGTQSTWENTVAILQNFKKIVTGTESFRQNVGGPILIAKMTKEAAENSLWSFWNLVAMLSITLAIINILPFPVLDGGHLMFLLWEGITRRAPSVKVRLVVQQIGMVIILLFFAFVIWNDIMKL